MVRAREPGAIRSLLDRIADEWTLLVIATLDDQRLRFTELQRRIPGVSQRMLSRTLMHLGRHGLRQGSCACCGL